MEFQVTKHLPERGRWYMVYEALGKGEVIYSRRAEGETFSYD